MTTIEKQIKLHRELDSALEDFDRRHRELRAEVEAAVAANDNEAAKALEERIEAIAAEGLELQKRAALLVRGPEQLSEDYPGFEDEEGRELLRRAAGLSLEERIELIANVSAETRKFAVAARFTASEEENAAIDAALEEKDRALGDRLGYEAHRREQGQDV